MNSTFRRQVVSLRARALIVGVLGLAMVDRAHAVVMVKSADGKSSKKVEVTPIKPVVLPDRKDVLAVDWVDTKNARLAVGGLTYQVRGALPGITLSDGTRVKDIGYLKKGTHVRIQLATDAKGVNRLSDVRVVNAADASGATGQGASSGTTPSVAPSGTSAPVPSLPFAPAVKTSPGGKATPAARAQ